MVRTKRGHLVVSVLWINHEKGTAGLVCQGTEYPKSKRWPAVRPLADLVADGGRAEILGMCKRHILVGNN
jgi:hypothetical protein